MRVGIDGELIYLYFEKILKFTSTDKAAAASSSFKILWSSVLCWAIIGSFFIDVRELGGESFLSLF